MLVQKRGSVTEVYYFDGKTVRQVGLSGGDDHVKSTIATLDRIEAFYRSDAMPRVVVDLNPVEDRGR